MFVAQPSMFRDAVYDYKQHPVMIKAASLTVIMLQPQSQSNSM